MLLERRVLSDDELRRYAGERDELLRRGTRMSLGQFLVRDRRIEAAQFAALSNEIEVCGRACFGCRRAYLVQPGGSPNCPACGSPALLPALPTATPSGRFSPPAAPAPQDFTGSGRFAPQPAAQDFTGSGRFPARPPTGDAAPGSTSGRFRAANPYQPVAVPQAVPGGIPPQGAASYYLQRSDLGGSSAVSPASPVPPTTPLPNGATRVNSTAAGSGTAPALKGPRGVELGKTFGNYELISELGRGGMGVVYKARHRENGQMVALKVLLAGEFASPKLVTRFKDEAKTVQKLDHPGIVPVYDAGEVDGLPYFTMRFVEGTLFEDMVKGRGLSARRGAEVLREVAKAAHHAHQNGVIHRDLKPSNVIIETATDQPFIMDFGLAKDLEDDKHLTRSGVAIGTPYYMPPEQAQGKHREVDARTDVYAIGAMLYQVLAKRTPFTGETQAELLKKICEDEPVPPSQVQRGVPPALETVALKALRKKKDDRYESALALAHDIDRALGGKQTVAKRAPIWTPIVNKVQKNPKVIAGIGAAVVLAVLGVAWGIHQSAVAEAMRLDAEKKARADEAARQAREAEEARAREVERRKATAEAAVSKGHSLRLQVRLASSASAARELLDEAERAFGEALASADAGEIAAQAHYERALVRRDICRRDGLVAILDDLKAAAASKSFPARAHLAAGLLLLRNEHDPVGARGELGSARPTGDALDSGARLDEQTAGTLAQAYLQAIDSDGSEAARRAHEAERVAAELAPDVSDALAYFTLSSLTASTPNPVGLARAAVQDADKGLALDRWRPALLLDRAWARAVTGDVANAREDLKAARQVALDDPAAIVVQAWLAMREKQEDAMRAAVADGRHLQPRGEAFWSALEERLSAILDAGRAPPAPRETPTPEAPRKAPDETAAPATRSRVLFADLSFNCDPKTLPRFDKVRALIEQGHTPDAIAELARIEADDPAHPEIAFWRARLLCDQKKFREARALVEPVLAQEPDCLFGLVILGECDLGDGKLEAARADWEKVIAKNGDLRTPRFLLGRALLNSGRGGQAVDYLQPAHDADWDDVEVAVLLARALIDANRADDAILVARRAVTNEPSNPAARSYLAQALVRAGRFQESLDLSEEGEKLLPGRLLPVVDKAVALWNLGRTDDANAYFKKAHAAAKTDGERAMVDRVEKTTKATPPK